MGNFFAKWLKKCMDKEEVRILMVGLDAAGKTTILYQLRWGEVRTTMPTIGFHVDIVEHKNIRFTVWDIGGQRRIRDLWHHYYAQTAGLVFVVDASDADRFNEAADELHGVLKHPLMKDVVVLIMANKQDMPFACNQKDLANYLRLHEINQTWHMHGTCATTGSGLYDSMEYLRLMLRTRRHN